MSQLNNIQQVLSNIQSIEKVQQQSHAQTEQSRLIVHNQKAAETRGKIIEGMDHTDRVEISVKDHQGKTGQEKKRREKEDKEDAKSDGEPAHIDIRV